MTPDRCQWRSSGVFIVNSEHNFTLCYSVSIIEFEQVIDVVLVSLLLAFDLLLTFF